MRSPCIALMLMVSSCTALFTGQAAACSCGKTFDTQQAYENADWVFEGRAVATHASDKYVSDEEGAPLVTEFEVLRWWKGGHAPTLFVYSSAGPACGVLVPDDEVQVLFAERFSAGGDPMLGLCSQPHLAPAAQASELNRIHASSPPDETQPFVQTTASLLARDAGGCAAQREHSPRDAGDCHFASRTGRGALRQQSADDTTSGASCAATQAPAPHPWRAASLFLALLTLVCIRRH